MRNTLFLAMLGSVLLLVGCQPGAPPGLENIRPAKVTVTDGGKPIDGVRVTLNPKTPTGAMGFGEITNGSGTAVIMTTQGTLRAKGVPEGEYVVLLNKSVSLPADLEPKEEDQSLSPQKAAELQKKREEFFSKNQLIPKKLEKEEGNPLVLTVGASGGELTVDISQYK